MGPNGRRRLFAMPLADDAEARSAAYGVKRPTAARRWLAGLE